MCGTPGLMRPVIVPLCTNEHCPVLAWDPFSTIATNIANASEVDLSEETGAGDAWGS
jgi:hypothetical protein